MNARTARLRAVVESASNWQQPLARPLHLRDGQILATLADARKALTGGRRVAVTAENIDSVLELLGQAALAGDYRIVDRATERTHVALMMQRQM